MARAVEVVGRLINPKKARQTLMLPDCRKKLAPTREYLVHVALVPDIPDQLVFRQGIDFVEGQGQLDDPKRWGQMAAGFRDSLSQIDADFLGQCFKLFGRKRFDISRAIDAVQQRLCRGFGQAVHAGQFFLGGSIWGRKHHA